MSVAEFVLGSSPGGVDIEAQINKMKARMVRIYSQDWRDC
jgi:hypothetical protein